MNKSGRLEFKRYNKNYLKYFEKEKKNLSGLGKFEVHHVGSTAVPGMPGKPEIDILILLKTDRQRKNLVGKLVNIGYNRTKIKDRNRLFFWTERNWQIFNLHLILANYKKPRDQLKFRDYLIKNQKEFKKYLKLKKKNLKKSKRWRAAYRNLKKEYFLKLKI